MGLPIFVVDAFAAEAFGGNPAAVVLGHGADAWMQDVAAEMRHSETAFVRARDDGGHDLRWFTPTVEIDLCGHATLASAHVLYETGLLPTDVTARFHTRSGELRARHAGSRGVTLDFPSEEPVARPPMPALFAALGLARPPREFLGVEGAFFMCVLDDARAVRDLAPDFAAMRALSDVRGCYVTAPGDGARDGERGGERDGERDFDVVSRAFAPRVGIDEDPVTGSMHCVLVAYWGPRLGKDELRAYQASARGGALTVRREGDRALLTGRATTVLEGTLRD